MFTSLATGNPMLFLFLIVGGLLFFAVVFGIGFLVAGTVKILVGFFLPAVLLVFGLFQMAKGSLRMGAVLVTIAVVIFSLVASGVILA